jgi:hypothetical protein
LLNFQIKKCNPEDVDGCPYCNLCPPRLPEDLYKDLHFLPDPVLHEGRYKSFEETYGTLTDDRDRPSRKATPEATDRDKKFKSLLVSGKY